MPDAIGSVNTNNNNNNNKDEGAASSLGVIDDETIRDAFAVQDSMQDPGALPEPEEVDERSTFTPCDPDDMAPGDFAGRLSATENDIPDPSCSDQLNCSSCLAKRACGWCAVSRMCVNTRSDAKECAFNENTDVCAPPCPHMWHMSWPAGRQNIVDDFCDSISVAYANSTLESFSNINITVEATEADLAAEAMKTVTTADNARILEPVLEAAGTTESVAVENEAVGGTFDSGLTTPTTVATETASDGNVAASSATVVESSKRFKSQAMFVVLSN